MTPTRRTPTSKWLFRLDCIYNNRGSTELHSHPGSGIGCMLAGHLRVESDKGECSDNRLTGDCRHEEGSYPLVSPPILGRLPISFGAWCMLELGNYRLPSQTLSGRPGGS